MDKQELLEIYDGLPFMEDIEEITNICDKAKLYFLNYLLNKCNGGYLELYSCYDILNQKLSPIEQIFNIVYYQYCNEFYRWNPNADIYDEYTNIPIHAMFMEELASQKEIIYNEQKYIADFVLDLSRKGKSRFMYPKLKKLKYIIELDGFQYHSKKQQINKDYEREINLQSLGYKVIRFTGSQVYNNPYSCVDKFINIVLNDIKEISENE